MSDVLNREYSAEFDKLRKSRVEVSFYKYGPARENFATKGDAIFESLITEVIAAERLLDIHLS